MEIITYFLIGKPINIGLVACIFFAGYFWLKKNKKKGNAFLISGIVWFFYALWELLLKIKTPEANIRVDLLIIWPILVALLIWVFLSLVYNGIKLKK
ncbi:hypothetical protein [Acinetobacter johnsonii]|uniref:hypothetical protein n=1 Tax=Acinetobacter johnsonii TaxID=40214 RepID=UPI0014389EC9|nr:hypothetical protein [Acinetobacter johnsonii]NKG36479.1 hypothetical protein [Acinetobacter johnsonii]